MPIKKDELHKMSDPEIVEETARLRAKLYELRQQAVTEKLENPNRITQVKRDIARIFTVMTERGETGVEEQQYHLESIATHRRGG